MKHAADKIQSRLRGKDWPSYSIELVDQILLFPVDGEFDAAAAAHHTGGRPRSGTRSRHEGQTHVITIPSERGTFRGRGTTVAFTRRRIRHLRRHGQPRRCALSRRPRRRALGLDQPIPGAARKLPVHIGL